MAATAVLFFAYRRRTSKRNSDRDDESVRETLMKSDISPDPSAGLAHHQLGDDPQLSAKQGMLRVTSIHNGLDRIKEYSPFQWTLAHSRPVWNTEATDSTDPITIEQNLKIRTDAAVVHLQTRAHRFILQLVRCGNRQTRRIPIGLACVHLARSAGKEAILDLVGTETGLDHVGVSLMIDGTMEVWVELFDVHTTRVCIEQHLRTSDPRRHEKYFFTELIQQTCCPAIGASVANGQSN